MGDNFIDDAEANFLRRKTSNGSDKATHIFKWLDSAGWQSKRLAQLSISFDFAMRQLGWDKTITIINGKPTIVDGNGLYLTSLVKVGQTTIGAKYHEDYKEIALAEEKIDKLARSKAPSPMLS